MLDALLTRAKRDHGVEAELEAIRTMAGPHGNVVDDRLVREAAAISRRHGVTFSQPGGLTAGATSSIFVERAGTKHDAHGTSVASPISPMSMSRRTISSGPYSFIATSPLR